MEESSRNRKIDIIKGIAMWFVIWGHAIQYCYAGKQDFFENPVFKFIYGFHMPLFMMISGYLFFWSCQKYKNKKKIIKKQIWHIGYPLLVWNVINWICKCLYQRKGILSAKDFMISLYDSLTGLWFLWSTLIISLLIAILYFTATNSLQRGIGYFVVFAVLILLPEKIEPCKTMNIWMYPYFLTGFIGHRMWQKRIKKSKVYKVKYICLVAYPVLVHYFQRRDYIYTSGINPFRSEYGFLNQVGINFYRWVVGYVGIIFIMVILQQLFRIASAEKFLSLLEQVGKVTLQMYVLQRLLLEEVFGRMYKIAITDVWGGVNPLTQNKMLYSVVWTSGIGILCMFIVYQIIMLIRNNDKLNRWMFGR